MSDEYDAGIDDGYIDDPAGWEKIHERLDKIVESVKEIREMLQ